MYVYVVIGVEGCVIDSLEDRGDGLGGWLQLGPLLEIRLHSLAG